MPDQDTPFQNLLDSELREAMRGLQERERHLVGLVETARKAGASLPEAITRWADEADARNGFDTLGREAAERLQAQESLQRSEERYRSVVEHLGEGMVVVQGTRFVFVNSRAAELAEMSVEEMLREGYLHRIHPDDRPIVDERRRRRLAGEEVPSRYEIRLLLPQAGVRWIDIGVTIVPWDGGPGTLTFFSDVTERKALEARLTSSLQERAATLESSLRRQSELNELRSRFVSMTSHEFRTPLASIQSSAELLRDYGDRLPAPEKEQIFQTIEDSVRRMTGMLERVLQIGRADARMLEFKPAPHDLVLLCSALVQEALTAQPAVADRVVTDFSTPGVLNGPYDETLLRHIVVNLLSNAIKYSPAGGEIRFCITPEGAFNRLEVSDHGIGIPASELPHLFEAFHRASNVGHIHGTGLGLAIVKNSVELHGGRIEVVSEPGQGTRFLVWLPAG